MPCLRSRNVCWFASCVALAVILSAVSVVRADDKSPDKPAGKAAGEKPSAKGTSLFDGKTFNGWEGDTEKSFRIQDGAIVGGNLKERIPRNEFLTTKKSYSNFELRLQFKVVGKDVNAGIQIRSKRIPNHHEMIGYQADIGQGYWGALYDESRRRKVLAGPEAEKIAKIRKLDDWNEYVIRCEGPRIQLFLNGVQTVDYAEKEPNIEQEGLIGLQIHAGPPSEAWYRNITIVELPAK